HLFADLALVATDAPAPLLNDLTHRWPALPIVAVSVDADVPVRASRQVRTVRLEPHAIRSAVLREIPQHSAAALGATVHRIVQALQAELAYAFTALRSFAALHGAGAGADTYALLGALATEQCQAIIQSAERLHDFRGRPRSVQMSEGFLGVLCAALEDRDQPSGARDVLYEYTAAPD